MELLLNLAWLLLAVPAYCLWRGSRNPAMRRESSARQSLLALGCLLVVLFPVISATDDMHALGAEIEESPGNKRGVRHASLDRSPVWNFQLQTPPSLLATRHSLVPRFEYADLPLGPALYIRAVVLVSHAGRAPPTLA